MTLYLSENKQYLADVDGQIICQRKQINDTVFCVAVDVELESFNKECVAFKTQKACSLWKADGCCMIWDE